MLGLLGKKLGQTRVYDAAGNLVPVTVVLAGPNRVLQCKTKETDGYQAVQLGFGPQKTQRLSKAKLGHLAKHGAAPPADEKARPPTERGPGAAAAPGQTGPPSPAVLLGVARIREFRDFPLPVKPGDLVGPAVFEPGDFVDAIGITKGRGFEGVVKRHHFRGGDLTHGAKGWHRRSGAIGQRLFPGTVRRGLRMPGHMGQVRRTVQNLEVVQVLGEDQLLLVKGAVPGANGDYVVIREAKKIPKPVADARRKAKAAAAAKAAAKAEGKGGTRAGK
jgi:large subunit ribosomal protein L3